MGNTASVSPNESDAAKKDKQATAQQRRKDNMTETTPAPQAQRSRRSDSIASTPKIVDVGAKVPENAKASKVAPTLQTTEVVPSKAIGSQDRAPTAESVSKGDKPKADGGSDLLDVQDDSELLQRRKSQEKKEDQRQRNISGNRQRDKEVTLGSSEETRRRKGTREETASEQTASGSSASESYTSSSCSGSSGSQDSDGDSSDGTFYVPDDDDKAYEKGQRPLGEGSDGGDEGGGRVVVSVLLHGDREDADQAPPPDGGPYSAAQERKEKSTARTGKSKRKRPANRHYIKDETMRTLFGLLPFYGGDDGPMDQMVKATLASVGPNTIDVRNEAGDTLLILACQHACEDLVEPILAKGANPMAVNAVGICPLHFTCFADSLSFESAEALLLRGADPSTAETTYGCTPLHYAASSGDAEICALLLEHGAQAQTQDYYTYTAVKYAKDAGYETVVELLGGEEEGWIDVEEVYTGVDAGDYVEVSGPTGGLWVRHMDTQTELAYYMNDETGESWWETDLLAVAKDFLATVPAADGKTGTATPAVVLPPLGVREWLVQEQVRSWLVVIFSRADPLRLMEVDLVMQIGKADFKEMLKALVLRYGLKEFNFLRKAISPKLEALGVSALVPSEGDPGTKGYEIVSSPAPESSSSQSTPAAGNDAPPRIGLEPEGQQRNEEIPEPTSDVPATRRRQNSSTSATGGVVGGQQGGRDNNNSSSSSTTSTTNTNSFTLQKALSSQHNLKRVDSPAVLRAEADKAFQEAVVQQEKELAEERKRQNNVLDDQSDILQSLKGKAKERGTALAKTTLEAEEASSEVVKLQSALVDDSSGQDTSDALSKEIAALKAGVAAESVRLIHITEALEATKGSVEERAAKQQAQEEDRRVRLEQLRSENEEEVGRIRADAAESLSTAEKAWEIERGEMERELTEKVEQETALLKETVEGAAKVLAEASATTETATRTFEQGAVKVDEARAWMKGKAEAYANLKHIDQTNKQLHTSLRREMERAKQLHNQIEDMKGQARMYALVRPMDALEREAGCKEVCLRDGKQTLALLTAAQQHWTYTHVFQNPSAELAATTAGQAELHKEVAGLGTTLADGHNVLLVAVGASRTGKTLTLIGEPDEALSAAGKCGFFITEASSEDGGAAPALAAKANQGEQKKTPKKGKGKAGGGGGGGGREAEEALGDGGGGVAAKATPLAGIFPRLLAETYATLNHRVAQCAFVIWVSAAAVSISAASGGGIIESLVPPAVPSPPVCGDSSPARDGEQTRDPDGESAEQLKEKRDPDPPPRAPPENSLWGRAVAASSPQEVMEIVADARSRAVSPVAGSTPGMREDRHFLLRVRVELVNRSTNEAASCEMVLAELAEEKPGEVWPAVLAGAVRAHAAATAVNRKGDEADGLLGMIRGCLTDTAKVVTLLCVSPADNHAEKTERVLSFGKACENSGEGGAAQLKDLKKELARLKKEAKGTTKKTAPSQLPRPAGGKRS